MPDNDTTSTTKPRTRWGEAECLPTAEPLTFTFDAFCALAIVLVSIGLVTALTHWAVPPFEVPPETEGDDDSTDDPDADVD
jgi:hypothetical protein